VLLCIIEAIDIGQLQRTRVLGLPIGFSHAPAAEHRLMRFAALCITIESALGGALLVVVTLYLKCFS
jgi:precorrin-8X/cobalt-precorrin-8 methylmutase